MMSTQWLRRADWVRICLACLALCYAIFAGFHTVSDPDLGWQLSTGRYLLQHHAIPRTELFSYTAPGGEWIYPPFSGAIFYILYLIGGYSALSWVGALACAATVACLIASGGRLAASLAIIAVPAIAFRTNPRAELFTTLLFAAVLAIVWREHHDRPAALWSLPGIFFLWANLHLGFISGLGLLGAGIFFDCCDLLFVHRRTAALAHLKRIIPWTVASLAATCANPWGWRIYEAIYRQNKVMQVHSALIGEWTAVHFNSLALRQFLHPGDPASADWWLLAIGALAVLAALWKKQIGPAVILAAAGYLSIEHIRLQALYAVVVVAIGGSLLEDIGREFAAARRDAAQATSEAGVTVNLLGPRAAGLLLAIFLLFVGVRITDLVTDRYYLESGQITLFGAGPSWWYPERAAAFLQSERLPRNVFHDYGLGGYLTWRIGPQYPDFVDGRYIPFGAELFNQQRLLASLGPDTAEWKRAADNWKINTVIFSVARYAGLGSFPLQDFCSSKSWSPVYFDDVSIIFVRNRAENADLIRELGIRCDSAAIAPAVPSAGDTFRARAERFNYFMDAASIDFMLSRDAEAVSMLQEAEQLFPDNSNLHLVKAQLFAATNRLDEAEREYLGVLRDHPSEPAWLALARLYSAEQRYPEALRCVQESVSMSQVPYERLRTVGLLRLYMNQPRAALAAFEQARRASPYNDTDSSEPARNFQAALAQGRARAYRQLNELDEAITQQKLAAKLTPDNPDSWTALADLYDAKGQTADSAQARKQAQSLEDAARNSGASLEDGGKK